jgi:hypothetical protein
MIDEQEHSGASNSPADAPSISCYRTSGRAVKASQKLRDSRVVQDPPPPNRGRKRPKPSGTVFQIHHDKTLPTPPPTQDASQISTGDSKRRRTKASQKEAKQKERWEVEFDSLDNASAKRDFLLQFLGREDFLNPLHVPHRDPAITSDAFDRPLDAWDPLYVWHKLIPPEILETMSQNTNDNETQKYEETVTHPPFERAWHDTTGADIGAYIGALMLMGCHSSPQISDYWSVSADSPYYPISQTFSRVRFQQISRYFKPSQKDDEQEFFDKVEPLSTVFRDNSKKLIIPGSRVSIDENLIKAKVRSKHLLQISNKAAGKGYKLYTLCDGSYCYDFLYTSKSDKTPESRSYTPQSDQYRDDEFTATEQLVLTLVDRIIESNPGIQFEIAFDNFFTTHRLFTELKLRGIGSFGTAKAGSGVPDAHITLRGLTTKEKDYGEQVNTVCGEVNCMTFIDQKAVWMMSTVHDVANQPPCWRDAVKRPTASHKYANYVQQTDTTITDYSQASTKFSRTTTTGEIELPYPQLMYDYNHGMNGSDLCQQVWNSYTVSSHRHQRNWWPLFWMIIDASISNVLYIYRLAGISESELTHAQLQERLGLQLLRSPAAVTRKLTTKVRVTGQRPSQLIRPIDEHHWQEITPRWCVLCKPLAFPQIRGKARQPLQEQDVNRTYRNRRPRARGKQTNWGCRECGVALCHNSEHWQRQHDRQASQDNDSQSE